MSDAGQVNAMLEGMSVEEKVGQLICGRGPDWEHMEQMCAEGKYGAMMVSFKHLGSNRQAAEYINHLQSISPIPIIFCGGASHGTDQFIPAGVTFPDHMAVGAARSPELAYLYGDVVTREQRALGMTWIGAPNLDVNTEPANHRARDVAGDCGQSLPDMRDALSRSWRDRRGLSPGDPDRGSDGGGTAFG